MDSEELLEAEKTIGVFRTVSFNSTNPVPSSARSNAHKARQLSQLFSPDRFRCFWQGSVGPLYSETEHFSQVTSLSGGTAPI